MNRYVLRMDGGRPVTNLLEVIAKHRAALMLVERDYIDLDYRDELAHFYAETFRSVPDRCQRLHFFPDREEKRYLGFSVIRPIRGRPVSRTMLAPPPDLAPHVACTTQTVASPYGYRHHVDAFPFISQDYQYGVCAHAVIWMVAHYFHLRYNRPRYRMSDIVEATRAHPEARRLIPSRGLSDRQISATLDDLGMRPLNYPLQDDAEASEAEEIACRYLNSRLPVIVLHGSHAWVVIGYRRDPGGETVFVCHDDARGPYREIQGLHNADRLVVPLPGRIYLPGEWAESVGQYVFRQELKREASLYEHLQALEEDRLRLRTYVIPIGDYKHALRSRCLPDDVVRWHAHTSGSHWVWVVELQDRTAAETRDCVVGEVVIDATTDERHPNILFGNLPGVLVRWPEEFPWPTVRSGSSQTELYRTGSAIHA